MEAFGHDPPEKFQKVVKFVIKTSTITALIFKNGIEINNCISNVQ